MMDCLKVDELLAPYVLGSLGNTETARFNQHVDSCAACTVKVNEAGDTLVDLAYAVPQRPAPERIKRQILSRIEREEQPQRERVGHWLDSLKVLGNRLALHSGVSLALGVIAIVVVAGFWYSRSLQDIEDLKTTLEAQMVSVVESEHKLLEAVQQQRDLAHKIATDPGLTIKTLSATVPIAGDESPAGMILVSAKETTATISAMNLPQLPTSEVYQVWLIKQGGLEYRTGTFTVDSTGYGQTDIEITSPLEDFSAILITIERAGGSSGRTGDSVLRADL